MRFGPKAISPEHIEIMRDVIPSGTILELGSGEGTHQLAKHYKVITVDDKPEYVGICDDAISIHAPLAHGCPLGSWYDPKIIQQIPRDYDAILVDGPSSLATLGRLGFWVFHQLFRTDVPIFIDDVHLELERITLMLTAWSLRRPYTVHRIGTDEFGVIPGMRTA